MDTGQDPHGRVASEASEGTSISVVKMTRRDSRPRGRPGPDGFPKRGATLVFPN